MTDWVRLWHDMPTDPKWRVIARKSGQRIGDVIAVFNFVMVNASANASERGRTHNLFAEDIAAALDTEETTIQAILDAMKGKVLDAGGNLLGWQKRQPKREDNSAERAREWREERKRTQANASERPETETETEIKEKKETPGGAYAFVGNVVRLKPDQFDKWRQAFPDLDLTARLQQRDDWLSSSADEPTKKKWFIATSNWLAKLQSEAAADARAPVWDGMP